MFALWFGTDYENGLLRFLTPVECERLQGVPEGWTAYGSDKKEIGTAARCKALGNAIALPCAEYIMSGIADVLKGEDSI